MRIKYYKKVFCFVLVAMLLTQTFIIPTELFGDFNHASRLNDVKAVEDNLMTDFNAFPSVLIDEPNVTRYSNEGKTEENMNSINQKDDLAHSFDTTIIPVANFHELQDAINQAPTTGEATTVNITDSFNFMGTITIRGKRNIIIQSSSEQVLTQIEPRLRHFLIQANSSLTLKGNVTLNTLYETDESFRGGGVEIRKAGTFIMESGTLSYNRHTSISTVWVNGGNFEMYGGVISNNRSTSGGVRVDNRGNFTMHGGIIQDNRVTGGFIEVNNSSFTMYNGTFINNSVTSGLIRIMNNGIFTMYEGTFNDNSATSGLIDSNNGNFEMHNGTFSNNRVTAGLVSVRNRGKFTMHGGTISDNTANSPIIELSNGNFFMHNGTISNNRAFEIIELRNDASFIMHDGTISNNLRGTAVNVSNGKFAMYGGSVSNNPNLGVNITSNGSFTMHNGNINNNKGGGVYLTSGISYPVHTSLIDAGLVSESILYGGRFTMNGGNIDNNTANSGAGIYVLSSHYSRQYIEEMYASLGSPPGEWIDPISVNSLTINGGLISNNRATQNGGGIFITSLDQDGVYIGEGVLFSNNTARAVQQPPLMVESIFPNIRTRSSSIDTIPHPLNNFDIGFSTTNQVIGSLTITKSIEAGGVVKVEGEEKQGAVNVFEGTNLQLEAIPASGYRFIGWTSTNGGLFADETSTNTTFTMPAASSVVTAHFEEELTVLTFLDFFPDENLAQVVAERFAREVTDVVSKEELAMLTGVLQGANRNIRELEGMQYLTGLSDLNFNNNQIQNLEPLSQLTNVSFISMSHNLLNNESIKSLSELPRLMMLFVDYNQITDLSLNTFSNPLLLIGAFNQSIILNDIYAGEIQEGIFIRTVTNQIPEIINFNPLGGTYDVEKGIITWGTTGENTLHWHDSATNFSGTLTQYVKAP